MSEEKQRLHAVLLTLVVLGSIQLAQGARWSACVWDDGGAHIIPGTRCDQGCRVEDIYINGLCTGTNYCCKTSSWNTTQPPGLGETYRPRSQKQNDTDVTRN